MEQEGRSETATESACAIASHAPNRRDMSSWLWWVLLGAITGGLVGWGTVFRADVSTVHAEPMAGERRPGHGHRVRALANVGKNVVATHQQNGFESGAKRTDLESPAKVDAPSIASNSVLYDSFDTKESRLACRDGMRLVDGEYCATLIHQCLEPFTDGSGRCHRYLPSHQCYAPITRRRFCIDRYEYPNRYGEKPLVMVDFNDASARCAKEQKRLCAESEWTLACEGPEKLPYPYGYERDPAACNVDRAHRFPDTEALYHPKTRDAELRRIDESTPSGSRPKCVSGYGVFDMTGNVDEWVSPETAEGPLDAFGRTVLKGGYYGVVRARCRPSTTSHGPTFKFYQVGFRCCSKTSEGGS